MDNPFNTTAISFWGNKPVAIYLVLRCPGSSNMAYNTVHFKTAGAFNFKQAV